MLPRLAFAPVVAACLGLSGGAAALAAGSVELTARTSLNYLYYSGGFAIAGDEGEDGAPPPVPGGAFSGVTVTDLAPATLAFAGSDHADLHYMGWDGTLDETWSQSQTYSLGQGGDGAQLRASGWVDIVQTSMVCGYGSCGLATEIHRSTNTQALDFALSTGSAYTLIGSTSGGQWIDLWKWDPQHQGWNVVLNGPYTTGDRSFSISGQLAAGTYRLRNNPYVFNGGGADDVQSSWDYTMTLRDVVAQVPEPATLPSILLGLAMLGAATRCRRRRQGTNVRRFSSQTPGIR